MYKTKIVRAALLALLGAPLACSSSSDGDGTCPAYCGNICQSLDQCHAKVGATCVSDCESGIGTKVCASLRPPSQFTCSELQALQDCASYCTAFCQRVPTCGAFDPNLCLEGCARSNHIVCNPASVAARTCDQLKPEARTYQDIASPQQSGGTFIGPADTFGLCQSAVDCDAGQGCAATTNTCAACATNADCAQLGLPFACKSGVCTMVDCLTNADCAGEVCDTSQNTCLQCVTDADCAHSAVATLGTKCSADHMCVQCVTNADCAGNGSCTSGLCF